jgi:serine/threonine protein kinase
LGAGGLGITYIALDLTLKWKLAIKEYYPTGFGVRKRGTPTLTPISTQFRSAFEHGMQSFIQEGQALAKFQNHPGVVSVITLFRENGTSYLVMRYEDGVSLKEYLDNRHGRLAFADAHGIIVRVLDTLRAIHAEGILHRDISPENIYINEFGQVKLLDFGAAKHDMASQERSLQVTVKRGYSPIEQYTDTPGRQGAWTDVYAVAATTYRALTGQTPSESVSRREADRDPLLPPSQLGVRIPRVAEQALMRALAILPSERYRTIEAFQNDLRAHGDLARGWRKFAAIPASLLLLAGLLTVWLGTPAVTFTADRPTITRGQPTQLAWSIGRGSLTTITPDIGAPLEKKGRIQVSPTDTTKYALTAKGFLRRSTRTFTVEVTRSLQANLIPLSGPTLTSTPRPSPTDAPIPLPPLPTAPAISFKASPANIQRGQAATLEWDVTGPVRRVTLQVPLAGVRREDQQSRVVSATGRFEVAPKKTTTYTLIAIGNDGRQLITYASVNVVSLVSAKGTRGDSSGGKDSQTDSSQLGSSQIGSPKDGSSPATRRQPDVGPGETKILANNTGIVLSSPAPPEEKPHIVQGDGSCEDTCH